MPAADAVAITEENAEKQAFKEDLATRKKETPVERKRRKSLDRLGEEVRRARGPTCFPAALRPMLSPAALRPLCTRHTRAISLGGGCCQRSPGGRQGGS
jgi:hypothetical protein